MDEMSRFGELFTEEIQEIADKAVPVTTTKKHKVRDEVIFWYSSVKFPLKVGKFQIRPSRFYAFMNIT